MVNRQGLEANCSIISSYVNLNKLLNLSLSVTRHLAIYRHLKSAFRKVIILGKPLKEIHKERDASILWKAQYI